MATTVTLRWDDPEKAAEFFALRRDLRRHGWLSDPATEALTELVGASEVIGGEEENNGE
jgi:hypothetical protein